MLIPSGATGGEGYCTKGWIVELVWSWPFDLFNDPDRLVLKKAIRAGLTEAEPVVFVQALLSVAMLGGVRATRTFLGDRLEEDLVHLLQIEGVIPE